MAPTEVGKAHLALDPGGGGGGGGHSMNIRIGGATGAPKS